MPRICSIAVVIGRAYGDGFTIRTGGDDPRNIPRRLAIDITAKLRLRTAVGGNLPKRAGLQRAEVDGYSLVGIATDMKCRWLGKIATIKKAAPIPLGIFGNSIDLRLERLIFKIQCSPVRSRVGIADRLNRQFAHALDHRGDLDHGTVGGGQHRHRVLGIAHRLTQPVDLRGHPKRNRKTSGIVGGRIDFQPRG